MAKTHLDMLSFMWRQTKREKSNKRMKCLMRRKVYLLKVLMSKSIESDNNSNGNGVKKAREIFKILMMFLPSLDQFKRSITLQWSET